MSRCTACDQPMHPQQMTCGSCGASRAPARPTNPTTTRPEQPPQGPETRAALTDEPPQPAPPPQTEPPIKAGDSPELGPDQPLELGEAERVIKIPADQSGVVSARKKIPAARAAKDKRRRPESSKAFFSRAWALVVDLVLLLLASQALPSLVRAGIRSAEALTGEPELYDDVITEQLTEIGRLALAVSYFVVLNAQGGQTLGKALMGLRVVRSDGAAPNALTSLTRLIGYVFSALPFGFGFLIAALAPRRALHDYLAGTIVVRPRDMPVTAREDTPP